MGWQVSDHEKFRYHSIDRAVGIFALVSGLEPELYPLLYVLKYCPQNALIKVTDVHIHILGTIF